MAKGLTIDQVRTACERLTSEGRPLTNRAIRDVLGTGSMGTIAAMLRELRDQQAQLRETAAPVVSDAVLTALQAEFVRARNEARAEMQEATDAASAEAAELGIECAKLEATQESLLAQVQALTGERDVARGQTQTLTAELERLRAELQDARKAQHAAEKDAAVAAARLEAEQATAQRAEKAAAEALRELRDARLASRHAGGKVGAA